MHENAACQSQSKCGHLMSELQAARAQLQAGREQQSQVQEAEQRCESLEGEVKAVRGELASLLEAVELLEGAKAAASDEATRVKLAMTELESTTQVSVSVCFHVSIHTYIVCVYINNVCHWTNQGTVVD
jgi:predicted  nucleic acid-binding Zn-ribbon protein